MLTEAEAMEEKIRVWIFDEKKTVDYKLLSESFKIHVNVSKQHLFALGSKWASELTLRYSLCGKDASGALCVRLVFEDGLSSAKSALSPLSSISVHSLALKGHYAGQSPLGESSESPANRSSIRNKSVRLKAPVSTSKQEESKPSQGKENNTVEDKAKAKDHLQTESKKAESPIDKPLTEIKTKTNSSKGSSSKKGLVGMWEKAAEKKAAQKENRINEKKEEAQTVKPKAGKTSSSNNSNKKRKRVQVFSDSDSDEEEEEDNNEEKEDALRMEEDAPPSPKKVESEDSEDEIPATPTIAEPAPHRKRKVRREVTKQYKDEDGYMVTKTEMELQSEDDEESGESKEDIKPVISKPKAPSPKKMKAPAKNNKQASIMNFFMKK